LPTQLRIERRLLAAEGSLQAVQPIDFHVLGHLRPIGGRRSGPRAVLERVGLGEADRSTRSSVAWKSASVSPESRR
jgi:hypothetical protein